MKKWKRVVASVLTLTMLSSMLLLTGCKSKKNGVEITEDTPWFNVNTIDIGAAYKTDKIDYVSFEYLGKSGEDYVVRVQGSKKMPADADWESIDYYKEYAIDEISIFDNDGKIKNTASLLDYDGDEQYVRSCTLSGDVVDVIVTKYTRNGEKEYSASLDLKSGKAGKLEEKKDKNKDALGSDAYLENEYTVGNYKVNSYWCWEDEESYYKLEIIDASGKSNVLNSNKLFPNIEVYSIDSVIPSGDSTCYLIVGSDDGTKTYDFNLETTKVTEIPKDDMKWLDNVNTYNLMTVDGKSYTTDESGLSVIDFENKKVEKVFSFNDCNLNRTYASYMDLVEINDNSYTYMSTYSPYYSYMSDKQESNSYIYVFTKAEKNPNAGKTIIELACLSGITESTANAVCDFNETNSEYYIIYNDDYTELNIDYESIESSEDWSKAYLNAQSEMSNKLAIDLMNGDGPDIIVGGCKYGQLNNEDYLIDLSSKMDKFGTEGYFSNVINDSKIDGKLYQVPISFCINGIITDAKNIKKGNVGFTFDEYKTFVDKVCNGDDPIYGGQIEYLVTCADNMNDLFRDGTKSSYDNEAFRELCKYVKENVNDEINVDEGGDVWIEDEWVEPVANFVTLSGFASYLDYFGQSDDGQEKAFVGLPSYDGRGPQIQLTSSVGISSQAVDEDACWSFVELLLSEKSQDDIAKAWDFPINVNSYEKIAKEMVKNYNKMVDEEENYSFSGRNNYKKLDESIVTDLETDCINNSRVIFSDPSITVIITEEVPAYLSGQKSIDDVIKILEDRVNKVLSERG